MAIYTFFLSRDDKAAITFEAFELAGDDHAGEIAASVLAEHPSASHLSIWQGDRPLGQVSRSDVSLPLLVGQG